MGHKKGTTFIHKQQKPQLPLILSTERNKGIEFRVKIDYLPVRTKCAKFLINELRKNHLLNALKLNKTASHCFS